MTLSQQISFITTYTDLSIEQNRIRIGVCPLGIKPSDFITYYDNAVENTLQNALEECINYLKANNKYLNIKLVIKN